jgi:hypothetical protein
VPNLPVNLGHPDQLTEAAATLAGLRPRPAAPYDIAVAPQAEWPAACPRCCCAFIVMAGTAALIKFLLS